MIGSYFFKLLRSPFFYAGMICTLALCVFYANDYLGGSGGLGGQDVFTDMRLLLETKGYRKAFIIFGAIPFAANFADEWNSKAIINCVTRKSTFNYAVSNVVVCFVSSLLTVYIPLSVYFVISSLGDKVLYDSSYDHLLVMGSPFLSIVLYFLTYSLSCAMWAVTGMTLSAFFPSKYIAMGAPFVLSAVFERITFGLPWRISLMGLSMSYTGHSAAWSLGYGFLVFGGLSLICGIIFVIKVGKRVQNELG